MGPAPSRRRPRDLRDRLEPRSRAPRRTPHRGGDLRRLRVAGGLTGLAALLNSVRFNQIPSNAGLGLELKVIAAVVVGGTAITGGRGSVAGTVLGVILLGAIGPALTFLGVSAYWERAIQGAIILAAVAFDALRDRPVTHAVTMSHVEAGGSQSTVPWDRCGAASAAP